VVVRCDTFRAISWQPGSTRRAGQGRAGVDYRVERHGVHDLRDAAVGPVEVHVRQGGVADMEDCACVGQGHKGPQ